MKQQVHGVLMTTTTFIQPELEQANIEPVSLSAFWGIKPCKIIYFCCVIPTTAPDSHNCSFSGNETAMPGNQNHSNEQEVWLSKKNPFLFLLCMLSCSNLSLPISLFVLTLSLMVFSQ